MWRDFCEVGTTLVDLLLIELMLHSSQVKQMSTQPIHLSHKLILRKQNTRGTVDLNQDYEVKNLQTQVFFALQPYLPGRVWLFLWLHKIGSTHTSSTMGDHFSTAAIKLSRAYTPLKEFAIQLHDLHGPTMEPGFGFVSCTRSFQAVSHPNSIPAKYCLTSVLPCVEFSYVG